MDVELVRDRIAAFCGEYSLDRRELGKIVIIVSVTLLVVSIQTVFSLHGSVQDINKADSAFQQTSRIISSDSFEQSLAAIRDIESLNIGQDFAMAATAFQSMQGAEDRLASARTEIKATYRVHQWLVLLGLLGVVSGIIVIYV